MPTLRLVSMMAPWTIIVVTAAFTSSCAGPVQKNNPSPEATTTAGTTTYAVDSTAAISAETVARLRGIQAIVSKAGGDNLLRHGWRLLEVDNPNGATKTPYAYYISSLPESGELMISTTKSDAGHAVIVSWLSTKEYRQRNASGAKLSVDGRAKISLSSCFMNMCEGVVPGAQTLFEWLRNGRSLTFSIDLTDSGTINDQADAVSGLFGLGGAKGSRQNDPLYGVATIVERTIPLNGIGPILDQIEPHSRCAGCRSGADADSAVGRHQETIADFTHAIALDPHDLHAYFNRATAYLALNQLDLAIADFTVVIHGEPANGMAFYNRGSSYERSGALDKALDDYRNAVRLLPSFAPAYAALGRLLKTTDTGAALSDLSEAIRLDLHSPALRSRAILYLSLGRPEEALRDFDQVIANDGSDSIAYCDRGVANEKVGHLKSAIDDYSRSIELAPSTAALDNRGNAYARLKQPEKAIADFSAALAIDRKNVPALLGRASANYARKRLSASLDDYTRVIETDPNNAIAYFNRGNIHLDWGEFAEAFADYSAGLKLDPDQAAALIDRAEAAAQMGRSEDAERDRRRALTLDPSLAAGEDSSPKK
jgi:tetratricopeptide (TPR) repeat protein